MFSPCELALKAYFPEVKAEAARILTEKHGLTQVQIAAELGVTQAAVSKYLAEKDAVHATAKRAAEEIATAIAAGRKPALTLVDSVCDCCRELRKEGSFKGVNPREGIRLSNSCDFR